MSNKHATQIKLCKIGRGCKYCNKRDELQENNSRAVSLAILQAISFFLFSPLCPVSETEANHVHANNCHDPYHK